MLGGQVPIREIPTSLVRTRAPSRWHALPGSWALGIEPAGAVAACRTGEIDVGDVGLGKPRGSLSAVRSSGQSKGPVEVGRVVVARGEVGSWLRARRHTADAATKALIVPSHTPARRSFFHEWSGAGRSARAKEICGPLRSGTRLGLRMRGSRACFDRAVLSAPLSFRTTAQRPFRSKLPMAKGPAYELSHADERAALALGHAA